ncbi:uncharacterized protein LOC110403217 isoform X2 [Numida meleagris]|uniref:uncharacterized protein LOC110403217 isoform X2 n=1 Tax=Numida meleagris TaxID=8996 RepID=UPI000B3DE980|nr:uncharacterized protein LOC110403217 isoform X2 [Numida meleagris]
MEPFLGAQGVKAVWFRPCSLPLGSACPWDPPGTWDSPCTSRSARGLPSPLTYTGRSPVSPTRSELSGCRGAEPELLTSSWATRARQPQEMCCGQRCWGLGSLLLLLLLLLLGQNLGLLIDIPQDVVSGTVGQSVLLPVSYRVNSSLCFPMSILWKLGNSPQVIITCTVQNCSLDAEGAPKKCSAVCFPLATYRNRIEVFPENASLLLRDLQLSDSGVYSVTFQQQNQIRWITLVVHNQHVPPEHHDEDSEDPGNTPYYTIGACSFIGLFLLFLALCMWRWGAARQKMRTTTQQQASNTEDIHMETTAVGDVATIYATVGENLEETKPRALPETVYTSVTFPQVPSALAPNRAGDRFAAEPR